MIGQKLKELRKNSQLTQYELAQRLGISTSAIGMYEQNRREPDINTLSKLCGIFHVSSDYLLTGKQGIYGGEDDNQLENIIDGLHKRFMEQEALMFDGVLLDKEDIEKIVAAIKIGAKLVAQKQL